MAKKSKEIDEYFVNVTQNAENDLDEIIMFIAQNNPQNAIRIMEKIKSKINTLDHFPYKGAYVPELLKRNIKDYRQITEHPGKIVYKIDGNIVNVLTIVDSRRNLQELLIKKLLK
jgi:plasmid stabilization system protein ParE